LAAGLVSGIFALLHGLPAITLRSNQIVSSTALNILAMGISMFLATSG
jgi:simple sugar transport system permease protein